jgi:hypothetical protein
MMLPEGHRRNVRFPPKVAIGVAAAFDPFRSLGAGRLQPRCSRYGGDAVSQDDVSDDGPWRVRST